MSAVILCQIKRAEQPFFINETGHGLYSVEELCWFMEHNLPLLDRVFFEEPLRKWLRQELGLEKLSETLRARQEQERAPLLEELAMPVFDEIGWLMAGEREEMLQKLREQELLPEAARRKLRADSLAGYHRYMLAIRQYREILSGGEADEELAGALWHNMGVSYARMFQMDEACDCFGKAWKLLGSDVSLRSLLCCCRMRGGREDFDRMADKCGADMAFRQELEEELDRIEARDVPADLDQALRRWVEEYHRETGL